MTINHRRLAGSLLLVSTLLMLDGCSTPEPQVEAGPVVEPKPEADLEVGPGVVGPASCERTIVADVVTLSQPLNYNRMGARQQTSQIFALARDVQVGGAATTDPLVWLIDTPEWQAYAACQVATPGACTTQLGVVAEKYHLDTATNFVQLRPDRRPRPLVLRANVGDCLEVNLANLLPDQPQLASAAGLPTNSVGFHPVGMELVDASSNDGQFTGRNPNAQVAPGGAGQHKYYASVEAVHFVSSTTDENDTMISAGLFGAVHVQPRTAEYYRSQVTEDDLSLASTVTPGQLPVINYQAKFDGSTDRPAWKRNVPILDMLVDVGNGRHELIYGDLTAIISGANAGAFSADLKSPVFDDNPALPNRRQPYREFTIIYHEPGGMAQAFAQFDGKLKNTLKPGADQFAINYGSGGIGAEILANRLGVGPMADCTDCAYEEFFLSAWTVGDPAMVVDTPAAFNVNPGSGVPNSTITPATLAYYPDDPSNVYHSYLADHVKMRLHHGGSTHHVHHLHAHQWLHSPDSDEGHYLDSQLFGPAASFTLEMAYDGSGNRNKTVGDSIFHCHFYPHFAQGMWGMWRVHDVFEAGTELEPSPTSDGSVGAPWPTAGARALPDGEIARGTPIPGLVPLPTLPMAPLPSPVYIADGQVNFGAPGDAPNRWGVGVTVNPGYPFFIPGNAGNRAPHPPNDFAVGTNGSDSPTTLDGGLPRHVVVGGVGAAHYENLYDFSKFTASLDAIELPEAGTPIEQVAMAAHAIRNRTTTTPEGQSGEFVYNGTPPAQGAPYADPCYTVSATCLSENDGNYDACPPIPVGNMLDPLRYKAADIQNDVVLNKDGWHNPQQRMTVLWNDVQDTYSNTRPPQPFFFRANSEQCIEFWLTNLVPEYYELDNFQVRTPTDILGQHIHLVKFDVTSSDGAANGWNYEDGTFSYEAVETRITDINAGTLQIMDASGTITPSTTPLAAEVPQFLCDAGVDNCEQFAGAQATVQRWWADPLLNNLGQDRTIRTVFTHDHFGPSTHQQAGLYSGLLVEPRGSTWIAAETDASGSEVPLGGRADGGPTSWQAVIKTADGTSSYREFALEFQDVALAYAPGGGPTSPYPTANASKNPAAVTAQNNALNGLAATQGAQIRKLAGGNMDVSATPGAGSPIAAPTTPQVVSSLTGGLTTAAWGTYSVNYRSEPLAMRLGSATLASAAVCGGTTGVSEQACDLAFAFASIPRANPDLGSQHIGDEGFPAALTSGVYGDDPFTPTLRAYEGERIQVRTLVGAHVQMHNLALHGFKWLFEPSNGDSGYRDSQSMGISEHFEMEFQMPPATTSNAPASAGTPTSTCGAAPAANQSFADYLYTVSSSIDGLTQGNWGLIRSYEQGSAQCLATVPSTPAAPVAWACPAAAPKRSFNVAAYNVALTYNAAVSPAITNANALVYTGCDSTASPGCVPPDPNAAGAPAPTPLVLRAAAGECISVSLTNSFDTTNEAFTTATPITAIGAEAIANSATFDAVALVPSVNVGLHPQMLSYDPQAGAGLNVGFNPTQTAAPGASVAYTWYAGILAPDGTGTPVEFGVVNLFSADPLRQANIGLVGALVIEPVGATWPAAEATAIQTTVTTTDADSFIDAVLITIDTRLNNTGAAVPVLANYATEPMTNRFAGKSPSPTVNSACQYSNWLGGVVRDPVTPIYTVEPGVKLRFRVVHPWGADQEVFELYGHLWQEEPFVADSTAMGSNQDSEYQGFRAGWGSTDRLNILIDSAGGPFKVQGDYLYRLRSVRLGASEGVWGVLRVGNPSQPTGAAPAACVSPFPQ